MSNIKYNDIIGKKFNRLTVISRVLVKNKGGIVSCICECGTIKNIGLSSIIHGGIKSCGCLLLEKYAEGIRKTHNLHSHPLYVSWNCMKNRCYNPKNNRYYRYGGRGVIVCNEWLNDFMSFYNWAMNNGWMNGLQLDKDILSPNKAGMIYCPEFCCFVTRGENMRHRSTSVIVNYNNETKSLIEWADSLGLNYKLIHERYSRGWSIKRIFETPCNEKRRSKNLINKNEKNVIRKTG